MNNENDLYFSSDIMQARRNCNYIVKVLKENCQHGETDRSMEQSRKSCNGTHTTAKLFPLLVLE